MSPTILPPMKVKVMKSRGRGRGVFAAEPIVRKEVIEVCPVIVVPRRHWTHVNKTILGDYAFDWGRDNRDVSIVLGYGMLYNHSHTPNARFRLRLAPQVYDFIALRDIDPGEEIFTNYNGDPDDHTPLWFEKDRSTR